MKLKGINASDGIAVAKAYVLENVMPEIKAHAINDIEFEQEKLVKAKAKSQKDLEELREYTKGKLGEEHAMIFDAHIHILYDPEIQSKVFEKIKEDQCNASHAYYTVSEEYALLFESMDNDYMKERATDVRDVCRRVLSHIQGIQIQDLSLIDEEVIIIANDLTPSETAQLNKKYVKGFITAIGGKTSHSAILARILEIPAMVGVISALDDISSGDMLILNAIESEIIVHPTVDEVERYSNLILNYEEEKQELNKFINSKSITKDGKEVELAANIGSPDDVEQAIELNADGIGLFRTEFLYMNSKSFPSEEEQFLVYKNVLESMKNKKVIIRTLDIGGDKELDYFETPSEMNPFLGVRALRLCLENLELFKPQLRALLRAAEYGNLHIMFPMIATLSELQRTKALLKECEKELVNEGHNIGSYRVGIMIEIPSAAILANQLAKEVDFFSIGTNDLIQYTMAADRMNTNLSYLYQPLNPALLFLIKNVIDAAHSNRIWAGVCGEMGSDPVALAMLVGLGIDEVSMSSTSILKSRKKLSEISYEAIANVVQAVLNSSSEEEVNSILDRL